MLANNANPIDILTETNNMPVPPALLQIYTIYYQFSTNDPVLKWQQSKSSIYTGVSQKASRYSPGLAYFQGYPHRNI